MIRLKTYDSTGVAPNGRLFAGDLNLLQDTVAALSDFAQTHDVAILRVGDTTLALQKFGAGELWFNSLLRVTGIFRALAGFVSGTYTTTQRNAIAGGSRPYGLVILNSTTNRYEFNSGTDAAPVWSPLFNVITDADISASAAISGTKIDLVGSVHRAGTLAARPAATGLAGQEYFASDEATLYRSDGSAWIKEAAAAGYESFYRVVARYYATLQSFGGGVFYPSATRVLNNVSSFVNLVYSDAVYIDPADYAVTGRTTKFRVRVSFVTNATSPGSNVQGSLLQLTSPGGAASTPPVPTSSTGFGSLAVASNPGASATSTAVGSDATGVTAGWLTVQGGTSAGFTGGAWVSVHFEIQVRNV